ncbi:MAG: hypothetical protein ACC661_08340, partial [Verrucomicrobiales bacterium]
MDLRSRAEKKGGRIHTTCAAPRDEFDKISGLTGVWDGSLGSVIKGSNEGSWPARIAVVGAG